MATKSVKTTATKPETVVRPVIPAITAPIAKAETVKAPAVPTAKPAAAKEEPVKKAAPKKAAPAKKAPAKKTAAKKEMKVKAVVEYYGKQVEEKTMIANVKKAWTKSGKKVGDIKSIDLYIKPEEGMVYYVINETEAGSIAF